VALFLLLSVVFLLLFPSPVFASQKYEHDDDSYTGPYYVYSTVEWAQTFLVGSAHNFTAVGFWFYANNAPAGNFNAYLESTSGTTGKPSGTVIDTNSTTATNYGALQWWYINFTNDALSANTNYTVVLTCPSGTGTKYMQMYAVDGDQSSSMSAFESTNSGSTWIAESTCFMFEVWGIPSQSAFIGQFQAPSAAYVHSYYYLNETIQSTLGSYSYLINATMPLNTSSTIVGTLLWNTTSPYFFIYSNPNGYIKSLSTGSSKQITVNSTSYQICFYVEFEWNVTATTASINVYSALAYDSTGASTPATQMGLFTMDALISFSNSYPIPLTATYRCNPGQTVMFVFEINYTDASTQCPTDFSGLNVTLWLNAGGTFQNCTGVLDGSWFNSSGWTNLTCIMPSPSSATQYAYYHKYFTTAGTSSSYGLISPEPIVDFVQATWSVAYPYEPLNGVATFTVTWSCQWDGATISGVYYNVNQNGTFWANENSNTFTDTQSIPVTYTYAIASFSADNFNLTSWASGYPSPSSLSVQWMGGNGTQPPNATLLHMAMFCIICIPVAVVIMVFVTKKR
jgi:hypothetical protein